MNGDEMISEVNRHSKPNFERRVNMSHELNSLKTMVRYVYSTVIVTCIICVAMLFYTLQTIESTCAINSVRYLRIIEEVDKLHMELEFMTTPKNEKKE